MPLLPVDVHVFTTGAAHIPPMGWSEQPSIAFKTTLDTGSDLPSASTCVNRLFLPTTHWDNYDVFKYKFVFAVNCAVGFGQV